MRCENCKNKLELYVDGELSAEQRHQLESHLLKCPGCVKELENLESINSIGKISTFADKKYANRSQAIGSSSIGR